MPWHLRASTNRACGPPIYMSSRPITHIHIGGYRRVQSRTPAGHPSRPRYRPLRPTISILLPTTRAGISSAALLPNTIATWHAIVGCWKATPRPPPFPGPSEGLLKDIHTDDPHAGGSPTKKALILEAAEQMGAQRYTPAEVEHIRRRLMAQLGADGKTSADYVMSVLEESGLRVVWSTQSDTEGKYEEEFHDLLHFSTLEEAEMCLIRLDELLRKFQATGERPAAERVRATGRLGKRRAEMIARNPKVEERKRAEKEEIAMWFTIWLQTPEAFFDW